MRKSVFALCLLTAVTATANAAPPADGLIDTNWGLFNSGTSLVPFNVNASDPIDIAYAAVADSQGRTYLVGTVHTADGDRIGITRLLPNGIIDLSYGPNGTGKVISTYAASGVAAALDAQGNLVVGGTHPNNGDDTDFAVCRFDPNGDPAFFSNGVFSFPCVSVPFDVGGTNQDTLRAMALQDDGKIVVAGDAAGSTSHAFGAVARLNPDGSLDTTFNGDGKQLVLADGFNLHRFRAIAIQPNGKLVLVGEAVAYDHIDRSGLVARLTKTGSLDPSFGLGDGVADVDGAASLTDDYFNAVVLLNPGHNPPSVDLSICAAGAGETSYGSGRYSGWVTRITDTGGKMALFGPDGDLFINPGYNLVFRSMHRLADGNVVVAGSGKQAANAAGDFYITRFDSFGVIDTSFNAPNGILSIDTLGDGSHDIAYAMAVLPSRFILAGSVGTGANPTDQDYVGVALTRDRIFADDLEEHLQY